MSNYITDKIEKLQKDKKYQNRLFQGKKKKKKNLEKRAKNTVIEWISNQITIQK